MQEKDRCVGVSVSYVKGYEGAYCKIGIANKDSPT